MNTIAMQIDFETDRLAALNDYLKYQAEVRQYEGVDVMKHIEAIVNFTRAKYRLAEFDAPAPEPEYAPSDLPDCGETFPRVKRERMNPDDPRRGQAADINRANRGNV